MEDKEFWDEYYRRAKDLQEKGGKPLPNGCSLYWKKNEAGGRTYTSDEVGGGVQVWDTALVCESTLLAAMVQETALKGAAAHYGKGDSRQDQQKGKDCPEGEDL